MNNISEQLYNTVCECLKEYGCEPEEIERELKIDLQETVKANESRGVSCGRIAEELIEKSMAKLNWAVPGCQVEKFTVFAKSLGLTPTELQRDELGYSVFELKGYHSEITKFIDHVCGKGDVWAR